MAISSSNTGPVKPIINELIPVTQKVGNKTIQPIVDKPTVQQTSAPSEGLFQVPGASNGQAPEYSIQPVGQTPTMQNVTNVDQSAQVIGGKPTDRTPDYTGGPETPPTRPIDTGLDPVQTGAPGGGLGTTQPVAQPEQPTGAGQSTTAPTGTTAPAGAVTTASVNVPLPPSSPVTSTQGSQQQMQGLFDSQIANAPTGSAVPAPTVPVAKPPTGYTPGAANPAAGTSAAPSVNYDPRSEALVANQLEKLMDPNSAVNRKAMAIAQQLSAQRGLQSSSIAAEAGTSALIDSARQIAAQDAATYAGMQGQNQQYQQNWNINSSNQAFQSGENVLNRSHEGQMFDKNAALQSTLMNTQLAFQSGENATNRAFQTQMAELQHKQQLGVISAQEQAKLVQMQEQFKENAVGRDFSAQMADMQYKQQLGLLDEQQKGQLAQMEKNAALTAVRDSTLQQYQKELTVLNNDARWKEVLLNVDSQFQSQANQFNQQTRMEYSNAQSQLMNSMMSSIGQAMTNPNMTAAQQQAMVDQIRSTFQQQSDALAIIYGAKNSNTTPPVSPITGPSGPPDNNGLFPIPSPQPNGTPLP